MFLRLDRFPAQPPHHVSVKQLERLALPRQRRTHWARKPEAAAVPEGSTTS